MEELRVENVFTAYDRADVLQDVSLTVERGTITCLLGSNGSGKTTLIRSILGLTPPRRGRILFGGRDLTGLQTHRIVAEGIACIPEGRKVFPRLTVVENLRLGAYLEEDARVIQQHLDQVFATFPRLAERRQQLAGTMSGGEQAMVSIGRGGIHERRGADSPAGPDRYHQPPQPGATLRGAGRQPARRLRLQRGNARVRARTCQRRRPPRRRRPADLLRRPSRYRAARRSSLDAEPLRRRG